MGGGFDRLWRRRVDARQRRGFGRWHREAGWEASPPHWTAAPPAPGINEKSSAREDEIHGTCSLRDARVTPTRVRLSVSSAIRSGTRISLSSSCTNRLWSPPLSEMTEESAAEYITSVPFGAITGARPAEKAAEPALERIAPGGVDQGDLDARAAAVDFAQHRLQAEAVAANIRLGPDLGVDRDHVALAAGLDAEPAEENQRDRAGLDASIEAIEGAAHRVAGQIFSDLDVEAVALELVGDVAGVVDRLFERRFGVGIFRVADHQRKPVGASAATDGTIGATDKIKVTSNARRILIPRRSSQQGADSSLRLGDLTLRKPHYQTGPASPVNCLPKAAADRDN